MILRVCTLLAAALATAACVTAATPMRETETETGAGSAYGAFLSGRVAMSRGDSERAVREFARAARLEPEVQVARERAFSSALLAGDVEAAMRAAPAAAAAAPTAGGPRTDGLARLAIAVEALADGQGAAAREALSADLGPHELAGGLLRPWAAATAGDWETALAPASESGGAVGGFRELGRAMLLERAGRREEADAAFARMSAEGGYDLLTLAHGEYLERTGRSREAAALYDRALVAGSTDAGVVAARARAVAGRPGPGRPTLQQGAARALLLPAVALLGAQQREAGLSYLHLALRLDPRMEDGWLLAGDTLAQLGATAAAQAAYGRVPAGTTNHAQAQARLIAVHQEAGNTAEALRQARRALRERPNDPTLRAALAGVLIDQGAYAEALTALPAEGADWRGAYLRGVALERAGRWPEAEAALRASLALQPENPDVLNHLGYGLVDRGEKLEEATAMLDRAMQTRPESGAIVDSVGWARFRAGRYAEAVRLLERAVQLEPGDPTVNDHLGDAYWRVGRRTEARFQWRRALSLQPEPALSEALNRKLATDAGLDAPAPRPTT